MRALHPYNVYSGHMCARATRTSTPQYYLRHLSVVDQSFIMIFQLVTLFPICCSRCLAGFIVFSIGHVCVLEFPNIRTWHAYVCVYIRMYMHRLGVCVCYMSQNNLVMHVDFTYFPNHPSFERNAENRRSIGRPGVHQMLTCPNLIQSFKFKAIH